MGGRGASSVTLQRLNDSYLKKKKNGDAMGNSVPDGDNQFLNSYRISPTVAGKEASLKCALSI